MNNGGRARRLWVALFATYALVLQSLAGAHASSLRAAYWPLEILGATICVDHGIGTLPVGDTDTHHDLDCCTLNCGLSSTAMVSPPDAAGFLPPPALYSSPLPPASSPHPDFIGEGRPGNPRAPPSIILPSLIG